MCDAKFTQREYLIKQWRQKALLLYVWFQIIEEKTYFRIQEENTLKKEENTCFIISLLKKEESIYFYFWLKRRIYISLRRKNIPS